MHHTCHIGSLHVTGILDSMTQLLLLRTCRILAKGKRGRMEQGLYLVYCYSYAALDMFTTVTAESPIAIEH